MVIFSLKNDSDRALSDKCLSDFKLTCLLEGSLKNKEKQILIQHINRCSDCRFCWMEASSHINNLSPSQTRKFSLSGWLLRPFNDFLTPFGIVSGVVVITLLLVVTFFQQSTQQDIDTILNQHYVQLNHQKVSLSTQQAVEHLPLPWEHGALGFSLPNAEISSLAFAAGLLHGRNTLSEPLIAPLPLALIQTQSGDWNKSEQKIHYQLGRWFTLLWYTAQLNDDFDSLQQFKILAKFNHQLQAKKTIDKDIIKIRKSIRRLGIILKKFEQKKISEEQLSEQLEIIMAILSPASLIEPS